MSPFARIIAVHFEPNSSGESACAVVTEFGNEFCDYWPNSTSETIVAERAALTFRSAIVSTSAPTIVIVGSTLHQSIRGLRCAEPAQLRTPSTALEAAMVARARSICASVLWRFAA